MSDTVLIKPEQLEFLGFLPFLALSLVLLECDEEADYSRNE